MGVESTSGTMPDGSGADLAVVANLPDLIVALESESMFDMEEISSNLNDYTGLIDELAGARG